MAGLRDPITDSQRAAARALVEGEAPTFSRVAACMGVNVTTVMHWSSEGGWAGLDFRHPRVRKAHRGMVALARAKREGEEFDPIDGLDAAGQDALAASGLGASRTTEDDAALAKLAELPMPARTARIGAILTRRIEGILEGIEAGRAVETRQVVALNALVQLAEKITTMSAEDSRQAAVRSDAEVAELYGFIEDKILQKARLYCRRVLENRFWLTAAQAAELVPLDPEDPRAWPDTAPKVRIVIEPVTAEEAQWRLMKGDLPLSR